MSARMDLSKLEKRLDWKSWLITSGHLVLVFLPMYAAAYEGFHWWWIAAWAWCGTLMNGLLNLMHECAHFHTFRRKELSDFWGRWLLGPLLFADFDGYRRRHWEHHKHLGVAGDTKDAYLIRISGASVLAMLLGCLLFREALHKIELQTGERSVNTIEGSRIWMLRTMVVQMLFLASVILVVGRFGRHGWSQEILLTAAAAYAGVYLYGLATLTVFVANLRAIAEHQLEAGESSAHGRATLRNFRCGAISRLVFGAYGFAEHATHHLQPAIPYYHLPSSTFELAKEDGALLPTRTYLSQLAILARVRS
jgi:fatty acid desaturase